MLLCFHFMESYMNLNCCFNIFSVIMSLINITKISFTIQDMFRAGLPTVIAQGAGTVWAATVLALTADPSPLHSAVMLFHHVFTDTGKQREVETMRRRGGVANQNRKALQFFFCVIVIA